MLFILVTLLYFLTLTSVAFAENAPEEEAAKRRFSLMPDVVTVQYAGNMGLASLGLGYHSKSERSSAYLFYGYLPKSENGVEVRTIAVKGYIETEKRRPFKRCNYFKLYRTESDFCKNKEYSCYLAGSLSRWLLRTKCNSSGTNCGRKNGF